MPANDLDYGDAVDATLGNSTAQIKNNLINATGTTPAQEGEFRHLAAASSVPIGAVRDNPAPVRQSVAANSVDAPNIVSQYPHLATFLSDPSQATLAQNDTGNLKNFEQTMTQWNPSLGERVSQWIGDAFGIPEKERARAMNARAAQQAGMTADEARDAVGGMSELPTQLGSKAISGASFGLIPDVAGAPTTSAGAYGAAGGQLLGLLGGPVRLAEGVLEKSGVKVFEHVAGESWAKALAKDVGRSATVLGGATGAGALGDVINSPDVGTAATKEATAAGQGAVTGSIFGAFGRLLPDNTVLQTLGRFLGISTATNAVKGEMPFQEFGNWDQMTPPQRADAIFNTGLNAVFSLPAAGRTSGGWWHDAAKNDIATHDYQTLDTLSKIAVASEVRKHDPEAFGNFVETMAPGVDLYVDAKTMGEALQQSGTSPADLGKVLPGVLDRLTTASPEADVRIPVSDYMAHIAGTPLGDILLQHVKTDPEGRTFQQAQQEISNQVEALKAEATQGMQEGAAKDAWQASHKKVEDDLKAKIIATGRRSPDVATIEAKIQAAIIGNQAMREGRTPEEQYAKYPLDISSFVGKDGTALDQPRDTTSPEFKNWFGESKALDAEGKPLVMYHGTARDISEFRPKQANAIFLTHKADFAEDFAHMSAEWKAKHGDSDGVGQNIMPVYVKAENPFDYENRSHLVALQQAIGEKWPGEINNGGKVSPWNYSIHDIGNGVWGAIESKPVQDYIRANHDSFYVQEQGVKNLAVFDPAQVKSINNRGTFDPNDRNILNQPLIYKQVDSPEFKAWSNNAPFISKDDAATHDFKTGEKVVVEAYHGAGRPDRIGTHFKKSRATSGPMAFHTSDPELASGYATGKKDTSIGYEDQAYANWFKYKPKGARSSMDIERAWHHLDAETKAKIAEIAPTLRTDDEGKIVSEPGNKTGNGSYDYNLQATQRGWDKRGNPLKALVEDWLNSGNLYDREEQFQDVLKAAGFPMKDLTYDSPHATYPFVYKNYIEMQHPLVTRDIPADTLAALEKAARYDRSRAQTAGADMWDKNTRTLRDWVQQLKDPDMSEYAWTSIPDKVTKLLASLGYDGIIDSSGKSGGAQHPVYIPFEETQVKSAIGNKGTFDSGKRNILHQDDVPALPAPTDWYYSELGKQADAAQMKSALPQGWKDWLKSLQAKGVKPDEIKWSGIEEFLDAHDGKITKEEVQAFLAGNGVKVQTIERGEPNYKGPRTEDPDEEVEREEVEAEFDFGNWETEEPDSSYMYDRASERFDEVVEEKVNDTWEDFEDQARDEILREQQGLGEDETPEEDTHTTDMFDEERGLDPDLVEERARELARADIDDDKLMDELVDQETEWYNQDSESPQSRRIEVEVGDRTYSFEHYENYGEHTLYDRDAHREVQIGVRNRDVDEPAIQSAIYQHLMDYHDETFEQEVSRGSEQTGPLSVKWESYVTGNAVPDSYREIELTLPPGAVGKVTTVGEWKVFNSDGIDITSFPSRAQAEGAAKDIGGRVEYAGIASERENVSDFHYTTHFPEANILGHFRLNEHLDAEGKRIMVVQEIQGDWGQHYRDMVERQEAYAAKGREIETEQRRLNDLDTQLGTTDTPLGEAALRMHQLLPEDPRYVSAVNEWARIEAEREPLITERQALEKTLSELRQQQDSMERSRENVPEGPFIAKTTQWAGLVAKRMIAYAVEHGFEKVVWTSGAQQVERWAGGLRKNVDKIAWAKTEDGQIHIVASKNGHERANTLYAENAISDAIGKAMAQQIIADPNKSGEITGDNITVSDTGMAGFYDRMLPNIVNDVLKKLDKSVRVQEIEVKQPAETFTVEKTEDPGLSDTPYEVNGYPEGTTVKAFATEAEARTYAEKLTSEYAAKNIGTQLGFPITEKMKESAAKGLPLFQNPEGKGPRGQITFGGDITKDTSIISLLEKADLTTVFHELGHYNLAVMAHMASQMDANPKVRDDMDTVLKWFKVPDLETWNRMDINHQRPFHEQFAQGFEKYLFEGISPNLKMQGIFTRVAAWMKHVYGQLSALNVQLTPEVRGVFDRMIASDAEIGQAQKARGMARMFAEKPEGMTDEAWHAYVQTDKDATETALSMQQTASLRDMKWLSGAKAKAIRDMQREARGYRVQAMKDAADQIGQEPIYKAEDFLTKGLITNKQGEPAIQIAPEAREGAKLNRAEVDALFPPGDLARPDLTPLRGMVSDKGLSLDTVAEMFGASSGREFVNQLLNRTPRKEAIKGLTDQLMLERHGEMSTPDQIERSAEASIHNELRARVIASEWRTLARIQGAPGALARAVTEAAEATIADRRIVDIKPREYEAAETRASKAADKAMKGDDPATAAAMKRTQLLNNRLAKSARDALDEVDKAVKYFKKFDKPTIREKLPGSFVEQIDGILGQFDLRQNPNNINRPRESLLNWAESLREAGYEPQISDFLLTMQAKTPYKNLTMAEMRGVYDAVRSIETTARSYSEVMRNGQRVSLRAAIGEMDAKMDERGQKFTKADLDEPVTLREHGVWKATTNWITTKLRLVDSDLNPQEYKFNKYDMHSIDGPFHQYIIDPLFDSFYNKVKMTKAFSDAAQKVGEALGKDWQKSIFDKIDNKTLIDPRLSEPGVPPVMLKIDRAKMLGIARHVGNESNFEKLTKGWGWDGADVMSFLMHNMTGKDWQATQAHWDSFDPLWKQTEAMIERLAGVKPPKIPARPFTVLDENGQEIHMRGGYSPIDYDPVSSRLTQRKGEFDLKPGDKVAGEGMLYRATTTKNTSLISRSQGYTDLVNLDFHSAESRVRDTIHDLAYREALLNATKVINDPKFREKFMLTYGKEEYQSLTTMLKNIRDTYMIDPHNRGMENAVAYAKQGVVLTGIAYRLSTVAKHGSAAALKSLGYLGNMEGAGYFAARVARLASGHLQEEVALAKEKFPEIMARSLQMDRDYKQGNRSMYEAEGWRAKNDRFGHAMVAWSDLLSAVPTAWAAYDLAITKGVPESMGGTGKPMTEAQAVSYANSIVRQAHGTANEVARSNFLQSRNGIKGLFGTLYGFMNNTYGQQRDMFDKAFTQSGFTNNPALVARALATIIVPALITHWITAGNAKDDESWLLWAAKGIAEEEASMVAFVRDAAHIIEFGSADTAPVRIFSDVVKAGKDIYHEAKGESSKIIQDLANVVGEWAHVGGLGQLGHSLQYLREVHEGKQTPQSAAEMARGVTIGAGHK